MLEEGMLGGWGLDVWVVFLLMIDMLALLGAGDEKSVQLVTGSGGGVVSMRGVCS